MPTQTLSSHPNVERARRLGMEWIPGGEFTMGSNGHYREEAPAHQATVEGFWLGHWMRERNIPAALKLFHEITALVRSGVLATEIGPSFAMENVGEAVRAADTVGRRGKVLLKIGSRS